MGHSLYPIAATVLLTITVIWHSAYLLHGVIRAICLATCITLTPMALTVRALRWGYMKFLNNTLRNAITLGIGHLFHQWLNLPSPCITPPHLILASYVGIIYLGYSLAITCYTVGRTPVGAAVTYTLRAL